MCLLTLCIPSNRTLGDAREAIETALAYAERVDCRVVVSDNSGDPAKRRHFEGLSPRLSYGIPPNDDPIVNLTAALAAVETPFVMMMGDDDAIFFAEGVKPFDLASLPADFAGIRPLTQIWTEERGVFSEQRFTIVGRSAADRILEYNRTVQGNNSFYYSVFRTTFFLPLFRLFAEAHPTRGGYCDWSLIFALVACGRMAHDPATVFRYNYSRWADETTSAALRVSLFTKAGLPDHAAGFSALLAFVDVGIFILRCTQHLDTGEREEALVMCCRIMLATFVNKVKASPDDYQYVTRCLIDLIEQGLDAFQTLQAAILMTDDITPGLSDRYRSFYETATAA